MIKLQKIANGTCRRSFLSLCTMIIPVTSPAHKASHHRRIINSLFFLQSFYRSNCHFTLVHKLQQLQDQYKLIHISYSLNHVDIKSMPSKEKLYRVRTEESAFCCWGEVQYQNFNKRAFRQGKTENRRISHHQSGTTH